MYIKPKTEILPEAQKELWPLLGEMPEYFVLYGGTAVALRYGHRQSVDFDFFTDRRDFDLVKTCKEIPFIKKYAKTIVRARENQIDFILDMAHGSVNISFLNNDEIISGFLKVPDRCQENEINIASKLDLAASKILSIHSRTEGKDYIDLAVLVSGDISLQQGVEAAVAIARLSPQGVARLSIPDFLKELGTADITELMFNASISISREEAARYHGILADEAGKVNVERVLNTELKAYKSLSSLKTLGRGAHL